MKIVIGRDCQIRVLPDTQHRYNERKSNLFVLGKLLGAADGDNILNQRESFQYLEVHLNQLSDVLRFMRVVVGKCCVVIATADKINVICSPSSPGFFHTIDGDQLIISDNEVEIYGYADFDRLSDMQVLNTVISHRALRAPFATLFDSVKRVIGGQMLEIDPDLSVDQELYIKLDRSEIECADRRCSREEIYQQFVKTLEATMKIIADNWTDASSFLLLSGGIDSAVLLIALLKAGAQVQPIHWPIYPPAASMAAAICNLAGAELDLCTYGCPQLSETEINRVRASFESGLGMGAHWGSGILNLHDYFAIRGLDSPLTISGQNMDSLYFVDTFAPGFGAMGLWFLGKTIGGIPKRIRYTDAFFASMNGSGHSWLAHWPLKVSEQYEDRSFYHYLLSIVAPVYEHVLPLYGEGLLPDSLSELYAEYRQMKEEQLLIPLTGSPEALDALKDTQNLSVQYMNYMVRLAKWLRFVQNVHFVYHQFGCVGNHYRTNPAVEGPLLDFFLTYQMTLRDTLFVKGFCYRYFREELGKSYRSLLRSVMKECRPNLLVRGYHKVSRMLGLLHKRPHEQLREKAIDQAFDMFRRFVDPRDPVLLRYVRRPVIRDYLANVYRKIHDKEFRRFTKSEIMEIERLVNLEVFLGTLEKAPHQFVERGSK